MLNGTYCCQQTMYVTLCYSAVSRSVMPDFSLHWIMFQLKCRFKPQHFPTFMWEMPVLNLDRRLSVSTDDVRDISRYPYANVRKTLSRDFFFHILSHVRVLLTTILQSVGLVAQSVKRLTTGWTVRRSNPGGAITSACPDQPRGPPSPLYNGYRVFPGGKVRPGRTADHSPPFSVVVLEE